MNTSTLLQVLETLGLQYTSSSIQSFVSVYLVVNPTATDAEVVSAIDGQLKHAAREKIEFMVDFLWPLVQPALDAIIAADVESGRSAIPVAKSALDE
jgi:hypothetical protein